MRITALAPLLSAMFVACGAPASDTTASPPGNPAWYAPVPPLRIVGPIHYVGTQDLGSYLITTPAEHILLDGAMPGSAPLIEGSIRELGCRVEDIRVLLISHAHVDHVGTLAHFAARTGATVMALAPDVPLLQSGGGADWLFADEPSFHFPPVAVDRVLHDGDTVELGGVRLTARHTPGHTPGCTTWIADVPDGGRTWRVVFAGSTTVLPGTQLVGEPSYPGIADDFRRAHEVLASLEPDIFLAAHASFFDLPGRRARAAAEGPAAFADLEGYRRFHATRRAAFEALLAEQQRDEPPAPDRSSARMGGP
jgi:metallo-beta-lactamase class B